jgi:hypothetical protein
MTTEEFLIERRLRAAELALESARRRVAEADGEIAGLRRQVTELEERALAAAERTGGERAGLQAELEAERRLRQQADQALWAERERARTLQAELRRRLERGASPAAERRLADAERHAHELRAELEQVRRRAAEFEQQVRLAVDAAWRWLGETGERVGAGLAELDELREQVALGPDPEDELLQPGRPAPAPETAGSPSGIADSGGLTGPYDQKPPQSAPPEPSGEHIEVIPARFDDALDRLRAQAEPDAESAP